MATDVTVLVRRRPLTVARRFRAYGITGPRRDWVVFASFAVLSVALIATVFTFPGRFPTVTIAPLVLLSGLYLPTRHLVAIYVFLAIGLALTVPKLPTPGGTKAVMLIAFSALMVMMVVVSASRFRVGSVGFHSENLLVDLRDRLARSATLPALPQGWTAESAVLSAHGEGFSGDFMVIGDTLGGRHLEVALVDVSGKGREAGTRSLLLSGALGALLGALNPSAFLVAANSYLVRQGWIEGFATAVHLDLNLDTGDYSIGNAGHPAPVRWSNGTGSWQVLEGGRGPVLGLVDGVSFPRTRGNLAPGDALMFYSDGIIESRRHDLSEGTDRMLGAAAQAMVRRDSVVNAVVSQARSGEADDRAVFVIARR
ncbi:PP2C family protein-serine/threonine phosphatase [Knoellia locipacati]|uniref:Membrane protein n=1 Tax=Knoellia locipacati TaxID=882824 RepID=A0A512T3E5_9MICO|nr:PP2C family protein-serine/threonine phosphatase [Knoellia locipacati]GEQ14738.1 membrane protein [Knoellia locipacati]